MNFGYLQVLNLSYVAQTIKGRVLHGQHIFQYNSDVFLHLSYAFQWKQFLCASANASTQNSNWQPGLIYRVSCHEEEFYKGTIDLSDFKIIKLPVL